MLVGALVSGRVVSLRHNRCQALVLLSVMVDISVNGAVSAAINRGRKACAHCSNWWHAWRQNLPAW